MLLSICVSVHNTADYLSRCLNCLVNQSLEDIEIVLVDNGSTDESRRIMYDYKEKYKEKKIIIISQNDRGLAQGRQSGIDNAKGEYIAFLDADDLIDITAYEKLVIYAIQNDLDIVEMQSINGEKIIDSPYSTIVNAKNYLKDYFWGEKIVYPMLWLRIYRRKLFDIPVFPRIYVNNEDVFAFPCLLYNANLVGFIKEPLHVYSTDNSKAVMTSLVKNKKNSNRYYQNRKKILLSLEHIEQYIGKDIFSCEFINEYNQYKQRIIMTFIYSKTKGIRYSEKIDDIKKILDFENKKELIKFIKTNSLANTRNNKMISIFDIRICYYVNMIKILIYGGR